MSDSPTFVATFDDGEITRMTVHQSHAGLDVARGIRLAFHDYRSRKQVVETPPIMRAQYVDGETGAVRKYTGEELNETKP